MKLIYRLLTAVALTLSLFSCSQEKNLSPELKEDSYSDNRLQLDYSGVPLYGKEVRMELLPDEPGKVLLIFSGQDWNAGNAEKSRPTDGVLPGSGTTEIVADITDEDRTYRLHADQTIDRHHLQLEGKLTPEGLALDLDVIVPVSPLTGAFVPVQPPLHLLWETDKAKLENPDLDINTLLSLVKSFIKVDGKSIDAFLMDCLREIRFLEDGNVQLHYLPSGASAPEEAVDSPLNVAFYTGACANGTVLMLNPFAIRHYTSAAKAPELITAISQLADLLMQHLSGGVPLSIRTDAEGNSLLYLDKVSLAPILETLKPVFENPETRQSILELIKACVKPGAQGMINALLKPVLDAFPNIIEATDRIELGICITKKA